MDSFKVKIDFDGRFAIKHITAQDEADACWIAKDLCEAMNGNKFDLMHV